MNPFKLPEIDLSGKSEDSKIQRLLASHGLSLVNYDAEGLFGTKALHGIAEHIPFVNKGMDAIQAFSHWQFQDYIPRLKMQMALDAFQAQHANLRQATRHGADSRAHVEGIERSFRQPQHDVRLCAPYEDVQIAVKAGHVRARFPRVAYPVHGPGVYQVWRRAAGGLLRGALAMYIAARVGNYILNNGSEVGSGARL